MQESLGHYRIESKLGQGGMGVVYRAYDTHLNRPVAIKTLTAEALADTERIQRFIQEARTASSLNHPNIIHIYDISEQDGVSFIAMEYVEGETLDKAIAQKGLPLRDALRYSIQIADALSKAHQAGVIHRDLKPTNIMVTGEGQVKVLDFGLAKLTQPEEISGLAPTRTAGVPATAEGIVLGTVGYMSPEQAEGKKVDARSDIFSLGTVIYEMITGRRAFTAGSELGTLAAILHKEPAPMGQPAGATGHEIERILARCLRKDPQRRWQTASDLKIALDDALDELDQAPAETVITPDRVRRWIWPVVAGLALAAAIVLFIRTPFTSSTTSPTYQRLTFRRGSIASAKFAPDGQTILYSAAWEGEPVEIFSTRLGSRESRSMGLPSATILSISPAGELAMLLKPSLGGGPGTLARAPLGGGAPREILEGVSGADWGPEEGKMVVARTAEGKNRLEYPLGKTLYESTGPPPIGPVLSPLGEWIAFFDRDEIGNFSVAALSVSGERRVLSPGWRAIGGLMWSPQGNEIWFSAVRSGEEAQAVRAVTLSGEQRIVAHTLGLVTLHDVAADGRVLLASSNSRISLHYLPAGEIGQRDLSWFDTSLLYGVSDDGKTLLFAELSYGDDQNPAIYLRKTDGSAAVRLGEGNTPSLSPDGKWVLSIKRDRQNTQIMLMPTGAGETKVLPSDGLNYRSAEWTPDGQNILLFANEPGKPSRSYLRDVAGGKARPITPEGTRARFVSPDGASVVITTGGKIYMRPIAGGEQHYVATLEPSESILRWSDDGHALFLRRTDSPLAVTVHRLDVTTGNKEFVREIKSPDAIARISTVAITPDGRALAYSFQRDLDDLYLVQGWK